MKSIIITIISLASVVSIYSQALPTITTESEGRKIIDWAKEKAQYEKEYEDGPGYFYFDCAQGVKPKYASSVLESMGNKKYLLQNINDEDPKTAWVEGVKGNGIGEYIEVEAIGINVIYNGYQATPSIWKNNGRVKKLKVYVQGKPLCYLLLKDEMSAQYFTLPQNYIKPDDNVDTRYLFRLEIVEVYPGIKYQDTGISEIDYMGCCFHETSQIYYSNRLLPINKINKGSFISTLDLKSGKISETEVDMPLSQTHATLLKIKAGNNIIEITPEHPLYIKGIGFASLKRVLVLKGFSSYEELVDKIEFLIWETNRKETRYENLDSIEVKDGLFNTYTIKARSNELVYIVNGFITKTY